MIRRLFITLPLIAASLTCFAQSTQKLTATKVSEYGLIYALPSTVIDVTVETQLTVKQPGEYYRYANKYLGIDPITEPSSVYTLKSVIVSPRAVSDPDERYLVQFKAGTSPFMIVSDINLPLAINTDRTISISAPALPAAKEAAPTILEMPVATQAITAEMLQSQSSVKKAELAAQRIMELRQSRSEIISGTAENMPSDGQAMKLALDNLSAQEEALTAMFAGTEQSSTQVKTFTIELPDSIATDHWDIIVARLSALDGLVATDDLTGDPIRLNLDMRKRAQLPSNEKGETKRFPKGGLAYRIPSTAIVTTDFMGSQMSNDEIDIAQYGVTFGLDPALFTDKKAPAYAIFNPLTGALVEIGTIQP